MVYFTKYAEEKFEILNRHKVFFTKEQVEGVVMSPEKIDKKDSYIFAKKEGVGVVYVKEGDVLRIITFYPVKNI